LNYLVEAHASYVPICQCVKVDVMCKAVFVVILEVTVDKIVFRDILSGVLDYLCVAYVT
jgi:hypothetical protein